MWSQVGLRKHHYELQVMEFLLSSFKSWNMMLWKCCTQYASKFGKLSSGHRTGKGQFSFRSQRKAMPKNVQTPMQLHSSHTQNNAQNSPSEASTVREPWTSDVQAGFGKGRGTRDQIRKQESSRKTTTSALLTMPKPLTVWITANWKILKEMGVQDHLICLLRNLYAGQEAAVRTGHGARDWFQIGKGICQGCILSPCLFNF